MTDPLGDDERERGPELSAPWVLEFARNDAHHRVGDVIESQPLSNNVVVASELVPPYVLADYNDPRSTHYIVGISQHTANERLHAKGSEIVSRNDPASQTECRVTYLTRYGPRTVEVGARQAGEGCELITEGCECAIREWKVIDA